MGRSINSGLWLNACRNHLSRTWSTGRYPGEVGRSTQPAGKPVAAQPPKRQCLAPCASSSLTTALITHTLITPISIPDWSTNIRLFSVYNRRNIKEFRDFQRLASGEVSFGNIFKCIIIFIFIWQGIGFWWNLWLFFCYTCEMWWTFNYILILLCMFGVELNYFWKVCKRLMNDGHLYCVIIFSASTKCLKIHLVCISAMLY